MPVRRKPRGGRGSNQYQSKPGGLGAGHEADAPAPEEIAWVFHPDRDAWAAAGFSSWVEAAPWIAAGFYPHEAKHWSSHLVDSSPADARRWVEAGFDDSFVAGQWNEIGVAPAEVAAWTAAGFASKPAAHLRAAGYQTADQASAAWAAQGFAVDQRKDAQWFPDPAECRRWTDWIGEHYNGNDIGRAAAWHQAWRMATDAGAGYDFDEIAGRVLYAVKPEP